jgi:hypothetical protein
MQSRVVGCRPVPKVALELAPARFYDEPLADAVGEEVLFPGVGPVLLAHLPHSRRRDRPDRAEVPERLLEIPSALRAVAAAGEVAADGDGLPGREHRRLVPGDLLPRLGRVVDHDPAVDVALEDLRDRLDGLVVDPCRDFYPAHGRDLTRRPARP